MLINSKNQGRDSTLDPSYLSRKPRSTSTPSEDIAQLWEQIRQIRIELINLKNDYDTITEQINGIDEKVEQIETLINSLENKYSELNNLIQVQQQTINNLELRIEELENYEHMPISNSFIDDLEPYNSQEGEG